MNNSNSLADDGILIRLCPFVASWEKSTSVFGDEEWGKFGYAVEANVQPSIPCSKPGLC